MIARRIILSRIMILLVLGFVALCLVSCNNKSSNSVTRGNSVYYCPMHPTYIADKPGDCPICNMKLVKKVKPLQESVPGQHKEHTVQAMAPQAEEKMLEEVCIEHNCTMKDCLMKVRANLKPGERIMCPVCGEVISTATGGVVQIKQPEQGSPEAARAKKERKIIYYRNPMNPQATSPVPMKDSMGMDYIPVYEAEQVSSGPTVMISLERQQLIGVKTERVMSMDLKKVIRASGKIAYDPELVVTQEEFIQALNNEDALKDSPLQDVIDRAKALTEAGRRKLKLLGMSAEQIDELAQTRKPQTNLYLPDKGENVWAYVAIYEYEIGPVKVGLPVDIEAVAYPGETFQGKVTSVSPVLDPQTRTNQVRVEVANRDNKLKPEMFVSAKINVDLGKKLALPESSVMDTGIRKLVYLSREGGLLEAREVKLGQKAEGYYEVLEGLSEGDIVVTSGNFFIDSESKLKSALEGSGHQH